MFEKYTINYKNRWGKTVTYWFVDMDNVDRFCANLRRCGVTEIDIREGHHYGTS